MTEATLRQLYEAHQGKVSDKWTIYLEEYDRLLRPYRQQPVRMLEIGIQNGGSLEIWSKFFPQAQRLVGCDINPDCSKLQYDDARIAVVVGDANQDQTAAQIASLSETFDLIIDDGSHTSSDIVRSFFRYFERLTDGGLFIAEDLHCSYWQSFGGGVFDPASSISFFKRLADVLNHQHWGVDTARRDIFRPFMQQYGGNVTEELLAQVHSVEFINSMCIIRKSPSANNGLGYRFVAGVEELVVPGHLNLHFSAPALVDERHNPWSARALLPEEEAKSIALALKSSLGQVDKQRGQLSMQLEQICRLEEQTKDLVSKSEGLALKNAEAERLIIDLQALADVKERQKQEIFASNSWRVTIPVRWVGGKLRTLRRLIGILPVAVERHGGIFGAAGRTVEILSKAGISGVRRAAADMEGHLAAESPMHVKSYQHWVARYDTLDDSARELMRQHIASMKSPPLISILMPTYNANAEWLRAAIDSVKKQIYPHWELCIADDASTSSETHAVLSSYTGDARVKVVLRAENGHISAASNSALELASGGWIALMDHDDLLAEHALFWVADAIGSHPDAKLIYSDEDKINRAGARADPYFKSDWNLDLFYSHNMFSHLGVFQSALIREVGGFRLGMEGSQDYDLVLRCIERISPTQIVHIPRILYHWRVHADSTAASSGVKPYAVTAGERALNDHFERTGIKGRVECASHGYRAQYDLPSPPPLVSLIIPTRNAHTLVNQCVESIARLTTYPNYEIIIVDNGSDEVDSIEYLDRLSRRPGFKVMRDDGEFNYSLLNNRAVAAASGEVIGLINNDIEVITPDWLTEMVSIALQPGVGAVGAKLLYPDESLQHGGVVLGVGGVAGHAHKYLPRSEGGFFSRAQLIQSFSAVTAACLVVRKDHFESVGGLDDVNLKVAFNDVDFCIRLREFGLRNVWTPYAELFHHESATRGSDVSPEKQARFAKEVEYMVKKWGRALFFDPAYNPNLTLDREDFSLAWPPRCQKASAARYIAR